MKKKTLSDIEIDEGTLKDLQKWSDETYCLEAVKQDGYALQYVKEQTEGICLEAVKQNGYALRYVREQTEGICLEAVKQNGYALRYFEPKFLAMLKVKKAEKKNVCKCCGQEIN